MINYLGPLPNYLDFQQAICRYKSEKWQERHLFAPVSMLPANVRLSLSSITHLFNAIFLLSFKDAQKFTRSITYPAIFLFTIPISLIFPRAMCQLWGFFPQLPSKNSIYYSD